MGEFIQFSLNGLINGAVYALIAVGIVAVYKSTRVVNFAHGHIIMFGAYIFYTFAVIVPQLGWMPDWYAAWRPQWLIDWSAGALPFTFAAAVVSWIESLPRLAAGLVAAIVFNALLGIAIERILMRLMVRASSFSMIMVTIGLISIFDGLVSLIWAAESDFVPTLGPHGAIWFELFGHSIFVFGSSLMNFAIAGLLFGAIMVLFFFSRAGLILRATAEDRSAASSMGINVPRVFSATWALACASGAIAGAILATNNGITPSLAFFGFVVLTIVLMGGLDSFAGTAIAALIIGWLEAVVRWQAGGEYANILPYTLVLVVLLIRPQGLLGHATVDRV